MFIHCSLFSSVEDTYFPSFTWPKLALQSVFLSLSLINVKLYYQKKKKLELLPLEISPFFKLHWVKSVTVTPRLFRCWTPGAQRPVSFLQGKEEAKGGWEG